MIDFKRVFVWSLAILLLVRHFSWWREKRFRSRYLPCTNTRRYRYNRNLHRSSRSQQQQNSRNKQTRIKTRYQAKQQPVFQPPKYFLTVEERKRDQYDERNVDSSHFHHHGERKASDRYFFRVITYLYEYAIAILTFVFALVSFYISILMNDPASAFTTISNAFSTEP